MNPTEILQQLNERYLQCRSYIDAGFVEFDDVHGKSTRIEFKTEFARPDYLCFEWQDYGPRRGKSERFSMVWACGNYIFLRHATNKVTAEEQPSLEMALARATGCSAGAAPIVPTLLLNELRSEYKHLLLLKDLELMPDAVVDGDQQCFIVKGSLFKEGDHVLWISMNDFSLRRVTNDRSMTAKESEEAMKDITGNAELMTQMAEHGIVPPTEVKHQDRRFFTEYFYTDVSFNGSIVRAPRPAAT